VSDDRLRWELAATRGRLRVALSRDGTVHHDAVHHDTVHRPTHVYIAVGLRPETLRALTRTLSQRLTVAADHLPVVLTDSPSFRLARTAGVVLEYLPDARTWRRHRPGASWDDLLTERLTRIFVDFGCERAVVVDPDSLPTLADLLA
jgi:hypothetical protein